MAAALKAHMVDAAWMPEPFITGAEEAAGAVPIADADQGPADSLPVTGYIVTQSWEDRYPKTAAAFRRAILAAQSIATTDLAAVQSAMVTFAGTPRATAAVAAEPLYPQRVDLPLLRRLANLMEQFGMTQQLFDVKKMLSR
jgi:NitT/TauT family transport system substrate-binding protein